MEPTVQEQPVEPQGGDDSLISTSTLPRDIILCILDQLRPVGPLTTFNSAAERPMVRPSHMECRATLLNFCLASREFYTFSIPYLYRHSLIKDRRELFRFFCTLAKRADRRAMVRSFAWVGVLWEDDASPESSISFLQEEALMAGECWNLIKDVWPRERVDYDIAKLMGIDGPDTLKDWRLLGAVLALCPQIKWLFMLNGAVIDPPSGIHPCPEVSAMMPFLRRHDYNDAGDIIDKIRPYGHPFLQDLELVTIEAHSDVAASNNTEAILVGLFMNSPLLRRIELKHSPHFRAILRDLQRRPATQKSLADNVEELLLFWGTRPQGEIAAMVTIFPKLISLRADFRDGSHIPWPNSPPLPEASEALLRVSETLEILSLTTSPETHPAKGHWVCYESWPSSLPCLNQMAVLKDLTTESMWLFGTQDPAFALQLPFLLPPSLVRLHLIDYWGNSDPINFYPEFPESWSPLEFYAHVLRALQNECQVYLPKLREVTFSTNHLYANTQASGLENGQHQQGMQDITAALVQSLTLLFDQAGVHFKVIVPEESTAMVRAGWAYIG